MIIESLDYINVDNTVLGKPEDVIFLERQNLCDSNFQFTFDFSNRNVHFFYIKIDEGKIDVYFEESILADLYTSQVTFY